MVQHDFSAPKRAANEAAASPTAALDQFLDYQNQSYFEELYKSEAVCLCILRHVSSPSSIAVDDRLTGVDCYRPWFDISFFIYYGPTDHYTLPTSRQCVKSQSVPPSHCKSKVFEAQKLQEVSTDST
jgi:hypothetical protein